MFKLAEAVLKSYEYEIDKGIIDVGGGVGDHRQVAPFFRVRA
jgi:hypothetical protein